MQYSEEVNRIFKTMIDQLKNNPEFDQSLLLQIEELYKSGEIHLSEKLDELINKFMGEDNND